MQKVKFFLGLWAAKFLMLIYKIRGIEKNDRPGLLAYRFCDNFIKYISKPKLVIGVTGTNGKTTVSSLITDILRLDGKKVSYNDWGANNLAGHTRCLLDAVTIFNKPRKDVAVIEIDEMTAPYTLPYIKPNYMVVTNLFRDSIKRNAYVSFIFDRLETAFNLVPDTVVILNADDPISSMMKIKNKTYFYGIDKTNDVISIPKNTDFPVCPKCYEKIEYEYQHYRHLGKVKCSNCGFKSKTAEYIGKNIDYKNMTFDVVHSKKINQYKITSPSLFNVFNTIAVITLFKVMGYDDNKIQKLSEKIKVPISRENFINENGMKFDLQVAKGQNGSSASTIFEHINEIDENIEIIMLLTEEYCIKDKSETVTWIYETDFSYLKKDNIKKIIVGSYLALDYKIAMMMAGIDQRKIICVPDEDSTLEHVTFDEIDRIMILYDVENITRPRKLRDKIREKWLKEKK